MSRTVWVLGLNKNAKSRNKLAQFRTWHFQNAIHHEACYRVSKKLHILLLPLLLEPSKAWKRTHYNVKWPANFCLTARTLILQAPKLKKKHLSACCMGTSDKTVHDTFFVSAYLQRTNWIYSSNFLTDTVGLSGACVWWSFVVIMFICLYTSAIPFNNRLKSQNQSCSRSLN